MFTSLLGILFLCCAGGGIYYFFPMLSVFPLTIPIISLIVGLIAFCLFFKILLWALVLFFVVFVPFMAYTYFF